MSAIQDAINLLKDSEWSAEIELISKLQEIDIELTSLQAVAETARKLIEYRRQASALNFQLEKADYFLNEIRIAVEALK